MELEKTQKNVGKMLERFRKGKEDMSVVFTKGSSFSRGGKDEQGCYSRGRVIIFRNEKKIVDSKILKVSWHKNWKLENRFI